ncbi:LysR family transcriptional regulator [Actinophytocola sp.]|uniref:LysR family transcriptional regulator n=1 Tax=Actinophytocola sp. TaxID=1872138 RepID=UPI00389A1019
MRPAVPALRLFRQVASGATVTDTGTRARLTQPALSRALRRAEREVGAELLDGTADLVVTSGDPGQPAAGFTPRVGFEGEEGETLRGLVTAGLGVALLPPPQAPSTAPHLRVTDVPSERDIGVAWLAGRTLPALSARFREHLLTYR